MTSVNIRARYQLPDWVLVQYQVFRAQMRKRRQELGLTQVDVARRMGRSQDFVAVLENNGSIPNLATVMLWTAALEGQVTTTFPQEGDDDEGREERGRSVDVPQDEGSEE